MADDFPAELHDLYRGAPKPDDARRCVAFIRLVLHPTALSEAAMHVLGDGDRPPYSETMILAHDVAKRLKWPKAWAQAAFEAEWKAQVAYATTVLESAEKAARRLIFDQAAATRVFDAAWAAFERAGIDLPRSSITAMCVRIAQKGNRGAHRVRRR